MIKTLSIFLVVTATTVLAYGQDALISPLNNPADITVIKDGISKMEWYMIKDTVRMEVGKVKTQIKTRKEKLYIITSVSLFQNPTKWIDSTVVSSDNLKPLYHSSYNPQRDIVLHFSNKVTGYYLDKTSNTRTQISEDVNEPFFESSFYPQLLRWLPLEEGYRNTISIFDYNPNGKMGIITATILKTEKLTFEFNGSLRKVWKVKTTDEISKNTIFSDYFIDVETRNILKQEIDMGGRKMVMELNINQTPKDQ
jgi:hypothetical protein